MLRKIISGGQTGADRAALDTAIKFNLPHGGWIPRGRITEAGPLPERYRLREMPGREYQDRTKQNVMDSQGTAVISRGKLTGGSSLTQSFAMVCGKPNTHIDLSMNESFEASLVLQSFILENQIEILNVAGPRASHDPGIYLDVKTILESVLYLFFLDDEKNRTISAELPRRVTRVDYPETVRDAVSILSRDLSLRARTYVARMEEERLQDLYFVWLEYARRRLGFDNGNTPLLTSCQKNPDLEFFSIEDGVMEILKALKIDLEKTYRLRVVK